MSRRRTLVVTVALAALAAGCAGGGRYDPLPVPDAADGAELPSTTVPTNLDEVALPRVPGTTSTTVAVGPGRLMISGRVDGPDGPVAGATVRLERVVGDRSAAVDVPTAADGSWNAANVLGGTYRIRAWLAPSFGMLRPLVTFVEGPNPRPLLLKLDRFEGSRIDRALAPSPPVVGQPANLEVRVVVRAVDGAGIVRSSPQAGVGVTLTGAGAWSLSSPNPSFTGPDGSVTFRLTCLQAGNQPLSASTDTGIVQSLDLPACVAASSDG